MSKKPILILDYFKCTASKAPGGPLFQYSAHAGCPQAGNGAGIELAGIRVQPMMNLSDATIESFQNMVLYYWSRYGQLLGAIDNGTFRQINSTFGHGASQIGARA